MLLHKLVAAEVGLVKTDLMVMHLQMLDMVVTDHRLLFLVHLLRMQAAEVVAQLVSLEVRVVAVMQATGLHWDQMALPTLAVVVVLELFPLHLRLFQTVELAAAVLSLSNT
jgi:hypothetical protein